VPPSSTAQPAFFSFVTLREVLLGQLAQRDLRYASVAFGKATGRRVRKSGRGGSRAEGRAEHLSLLRHRRFLLALESRRRKALLRGADPPHSSDPSSSREGVEGSVRGVERRLSHEREDAAVRAFHAAALAAGYKDHGAPGERAVYHPGYYGAFVLDPDRHNVEVVNHNRG
jgi:hypothetical protein